MTPDGVVMAIEDAAAGRWAVQFHPESILTAAGRAGHQVIANVLRPVPGRNAAGLLSGPGAVRQRTPVITRRGSDPLTRPGGPAAPSFPAGPAL